ncbi:PREDICTED: 28S ribosomal protein S18a, mitochondrial [Dinoponera quadriceps]|uniref:Large ribosomal subunit protein mL66 n=1 Tax=Dinoponera quadriceps TaxID=609295 RepID=A0A6P3X994_DINQU|nr:PREDICTED: 28S ribosomal protein S18a, mitochondrial [Dinoponera quadriceps]
MALLYRIVRQFAKNIILPESNRNISLSATTRLREIITKKEGNTLIIEGARVPEDTRRKLKLQSKACPICATGLDVKHTDVLILSQFLRSDGCMLPRRITGLCNIQQKRIGIMVTMAQEAGLMPSLRSGKNPKRRQKWRKYNTYYDESTIKQRYRTLSLDVRNMTTK